MISRRRFLQSAALAGVASQTFAKRARIAKVLVLGGSAYLGPVIVQELLDAGHEVTLFNRGVTNPNLFPELRKIQGDREDEQSGLDRLAQDPSSWDWVIDTWQGSSKAVINSANLLRDRVGHYQYVSTVSVYDKWDDIGIQEDAPLNPLPEKSEPMQSPHRYALRKTFSERALRELLPKRCSFFRSHGLRGYPTSKPIHEPYWQVKVARGEQLLLPAGIQHYQVTDMVSLARFMVHCGENKIMGPFNVAYSPFSFEQFIEEMVDELSSSVKLHWIPHQFLESHGVELLRAKPPGRYRFSVDRAQAAGLKNRPRQRLLADQLRGYYDRNPNDAFLFGHEGTRTISLQRELQLIELWQNRVAT